MKNKDLITTGRPASAGAVWVGPTTATLPTDASSEIPSAFKSLGHVSEDGLTHSPERSTEGIKDWNGDIVLTVQTEVNDTFGLKLIEALNVDVLKTTFGDENVTGTLETGITIKANSKELVDHAYIIDMIMANNCLKRIVIPSAKVSEIEEIAYKSGEPVSYGLSLAAHPDSDGNTHYEYIKKGA